MEADDDDDSFFGVPLIALGVAAIMMIAAIVFFFPQKVQPPPDPPSVVGCYAAAGAPDILVDHTHLRVLQRPVLDVPYRLEYHKGWAFSLDRWVGIVNSADSDLRVTPGSASGQFLYVSRELEVSPPKPEFNLFDHDGRLAVRYRWAGTACTP